MNKKNTIPKLGIYAPWVIYVNQLKALFEKDPEVRVEYDHETASATLYVENAEKAEALNKLLPAQKSYGKTILTIRVVPANTKSSFTQYVEAAFKGNEAFSHLTVIEEIPDMYISNPIAYCSFKKEVVQYPADDLSSETGLQSTLYENLAREILGDVDGVYFCTDRD